MGPDVKKPSRYILMGLGLLAIILVLFFLVLPFLTTLKTKKPSASSRRVTLVYVLKNQTKANWKDVKLTLDGVGQMTGSASAKLLSIESDQGSSTGVFEVGNIEAGDTRTVTVYAEPAYPGKYEYGSLFKDASGVVVHAHEFKQVTVR